MYTWWPFEPSLDRYRSVGRLGYMRCAISNPAVWNRRQRRDGLPPSHSADRVMGDVFSPPQLSAPDDATIFLALLLAGLQPAPLWDAAFCDVTPCSVVGGYERSVSTYCLHLVRWRRMQKFPPKWLSWIYQTARRHILRGQNLKTAVRTHDVS
jgi:hypothetical protein